MIKIDKKTLMPLVKHAARCASGEHGKPVGADAARAPSAQVFDAAHVSMVGRNLIVRACDGVRDLTQETGYAMGPDGYTFAVGAKALADAVQMMPDGPVSLAVDGDIVRVRGGARSRDIKVRPLAEYPQPWTASEPVAPLKMPAADLAKLLGAVLWARGDDRWAANLHIAWSGNLVRARATTGSSVIACRDATCDDGAGEANIPASMAVLVVSLIGELGTAKAPCVRPVRLASADRRATFRGADIQLTALLGECVWPEGFPTPSIDEEPLTVGREDLIASLRALLGAANMNRVDLDVAHGELVLSARDAYGGKALDKLPCFGELGASVSMNASHAADGISAWDCADVAISRFDMGSGSTVLRPWPRKDGDGSYVQIAEYHKQAES